MPRRPPPSSRRKTRSARRDEPGRRAWKPPGWQTAVVAAAVAAAAVFTAWRATLPARRVAHAQAAAKAGHHAEALHAWRVVNADGPARPAFLKAEARAALTLGRADEADRALALASAADPADPEPWRLRLERLRVLDLPLEAQVLGASASAAVPSADRRGILRELTLALLADLPDDLARSTLSRWAGTDPEARVALLRRFASMPRANDPTRADRIAELTARLNANPGHLSAREALVSTLLDAGEPDRARSVLGAWPGPEPVRDARYWRLRGRLDLDHDHRPGPAAESFTRALSDLPHDWKTRVRLARALHALGRETEARAEALAVNRSREALDPSTLGPRLAADVARLDRPAALLDLADLCSRAGLSRLADSWRLEAASPPLRSPSMPFNGSGETNRIYPIH